MRIWCVLACLAVLATCGLAQSPTCFTFQADVNGSSYPATGYYDLQFKLFAEPTCGIQLGSTISVNGYYVRCGQLYGLLDFGTALYCGGRWVEVWVRRTSTRTYQRLCPRFPVPCSPCAIFACYAHNADLLDGLDSTAFARLAFNNTYTSTNTFNLATFFNSATTTPALTATTNGSGPAVKGTMTGTGRTAFFENSNATNAQTVLTALNNGLGSAAVFNNTNTANPVAATVGILNSSTNPGSYGLGIVSAANGLIVFSGGTVGLAVIGGTKSAVVPTSKGNTSLYCEESTEVWFTDYGSGQLANGTATITIDPLFAETVELSSGYHVFVQVTDDETCQGVVVKNRGLTGFDVVEMRDGQTNASFSYRLVAKRKGFADQRLADAPVLLPALTTPAENPPAE